MHELMILLTKTIGFSKESAPALFNEFGEFAVQTHAMHCVYAMEFNRLARLGYSRPHRFGQRGSFVPTARRI
jgi:hypothetical protein